MNKVDTSLLFINLTSWEEIQIKNNHKFMMNAKVVEISVGTLDHIEEYPT